jgi:4-carboxymuconolactone decarboxylase
VSETRQRDGQVEAHEPAAPRAQGFDETRGVPVLDAEPVAPMMSVWDERTRRLVRVAAVICVADEPVLRKAFAEVVGVVDAVEVEEVILQSYLFAGIPRALNGMREWRRASGIPAPRHDDAETNDLAAWRARGEEVCAVVYGKFYERLRHNVAELHPALDEWMIVDGYGKVLGRPGLDLRRRELCAVAACAVLRQEPQLHSHLHGAPTSSRRSTRYCPCSTLWRQRGPAGSGAAADVSHRGRRVAFGPLTR